MGNYVLLLLFRFTSIYFIQWILPVMERLLKPAVFDTDHNAPDATKQWKHFFKTFQNFANVVNDDPNRLQLLQVHVSPDVYQLIEESQTYEQAIAALKRLYVKTPNIIYARHILHIGRRRVRVLIPSCSHWKTSVETVTAAQHRDEYIRDSFITGIRCNQIRQRLLKNLELNLDTMFAQACSLDTAQKSNAPYQTPTYGINAVSDKSDVHIRSSPQPSSFDNQQSHQPVTTTSQPTSAVVSRRPGNYEHSTSALESINSPYT